MIDEKFCVYIHKFKNGTVYIGKGRHNRASDFNPKRRNIHWVRLLNKYGDPKFRRVKSGVTEDKALNLERHLLSLCKHKNKRTCNIIFAENNPNISEESRIQMSQSRSGEMSPTWGMVHSDKAKEKISKANKGRFIGNKSKRYNHEKRDLIHESGLTDRLTRYELCSKYDISSSFVSLLFSGKAACAKGWRLIETPKESTGKKGKRHGRYDHTIFEFVNKNGITEKCTKNELCTKYGLIHASNISYVCNGKLKSYKGWMIKGA